ncbi:zinc finger, CCHC-type containing protein [Tanacetum coccineum]
MGDKNPIRTLGDYSKPSHEDYMNTIELPVGNNVVPLRSDTIRLVQNGCSFHGLRSEDPNQHLKDFLKLVDSLDLDGDNKERTRLRLFQFSLHDQASNWLERLPAGSIFIWEDLTTDFLINFSTGTDRKTRMIFLMYQQLLANLIRSRDSLKDYSKKSSSCIESLALSSELGSELTFLAGGELKTSKLDTSEYSELSCLYHYKQDKTKTRQSINVKRHIFNVISGTKEFEERDLNIRGNC